MSEPEKSFAQKLRDDAYRARGRFQLETRESIRNILMMAAARGKFSIDLPRSSFDKEVNLEQIFEELHEDGFKVSKMVTKCDVQYTVSW